MCIMGVPERRENEKEAERLFEEIMGKIFPNLRKSMDVQIQEAHQPPHRIDSDVCMLRHI